MATIKTKHWIFLLCSILLLSFLALFLPRWLSPAAAYAEIYQDGVLLKTISLSTSAESITIPIKEGEMENVIVVENGSVRMKSANCPDKLCVHQGAIQDSSASIVCLPHRLVIKLQGSVPLADAVSQ